ncbi:hypothetical protein RhiJN_08623 [Ceratobasidium sp. AG-Ba]|nr:hypothetical protein RhiJN_08623 [Ceratobasidium sp. AG-Ba]QRW09405.1 hypothetical protein RhiLY_08404 [Ceratobasidium sp. AG-Ba]
MAAVLSPLSQLSPRAAPSFTRSTRPAGLQHMSKHFAHPESLPLMLSLGVGTVGCYLGLEAMNRQSAEQTRPWSWKNYRLGLTEKTVDEVLFSINV